MPRFPKFGKTAFIALVCTAALAPVAHAQDKKELATRIVNLQKTQDMDALIAQLASTANRAVVETWLPRLDKMPAARQKAAADQLYADLQAAGIDVLLDDRNERPGVMFADMELIGVPHRIVVGERGLKEGQFEYKGRTDSEALMVPATEIVNFLKGRLDRKSVV